MKLRFDNRFLVAQAGRPHSPAAAAAASKAADGRDDGRGIRMSRCCTFPPPSVSCHVRSFKVWQLLPKYVPSKRERLRVQKWIRRIVVVTKQIVSNPPKTKQTALGINFGLSYLVHWTFHGNSPGNRGEQLDDRGPARVRE